MIIHYSHTVPVHVASMGDAKRHVRDEAMRISGSAEAADRVVVIRGDDGVYAYLDQEAADADDTGAAAFAVIDEVEMASTYTLYSSRSAAIAEAESASEANGAPVAVVSRDGWYLVVEDADDYNEMVDGDGYESVAVVTAPWPW